MLISRNPWIKYFSSNFLVSILVAVMYLLRVLLLFLVIVGLLSSLMMCVINAAYMICASSCYLLR